MAGSIDICLPIVKLSRAFGMSDNNTLDWDHDVSTELFVTVKGARSAHGPLFMVIFKRMEELESVNIGAYIDATRGAMQPNSTGSKSFEHLLIFGITKESLLAIRYQLDGKARRIQLRMQNVSDCRQLVDVFSARGLVFQEQQRPKTARPGTGSPIRTANFEGRPLTANVVSSSYLEPDVPKPSVFTVPSLAIGSMSPQHAPQSRELPARSEVRDEPQVPRVEETLPFATFQLSRSCTATRQPSQTVTFDQSKASTASRERRSTASDVASPEAIRQALEEHEASSIGDTMSALPTFQRSSSSAGQTEIRKSMQSSFDTRPSTTMSLSSATSVTTDTLEHELPPRRELPFKRPKSRQNDPAGGSSRPGSSSALRLPPFRTSVVKEQAQLPIQFDAACGVPLTQSSHGVPVKDNLLAIQQPLSDVPNGLGPQIEKPNPMNNLVYGRNTHVDRSSIPYKPSARLASWTDAPHEVESSPQTGNLNGAHYDRTAAPSLPKAVPSKHAVPCQSNAETTSSIRDSLDRYAKQSIEDRQAAMDSFMVDMLQNPEFTVLCEDVENCWRRIALGL